MFWGVHHSRGHKSEKLDTLSLRSDSELVTEIMIYGDIGRIIIYT